MQVTQRKLLIDMDVRAEFSYKYITIINLLLLLCLNFVKGLKYVFCLRHPTCGV